MSHRDANQEQAMASISLLVSKQRNRLAEFVTLTKPGVMMLAVFHRNRWPDHCAG